jgi:hypothetical protein
MEEYNPKEFWKLVKSIKSNHSNDIEDEISLVVWHDYFKNLNEKKVTSENSRNETQFVRDYRLWAAKARFRRRTFHAPNLNTRIKCDAGAASKSIKFGRF